MKYYFEGIDKQEKFKRILESWLGTPFRHHCGVKDLGCDCIHFVCRVLEEMEILTWRKNLISDYPRDWHLHNTRELLSENIEQELKVCTVPLSSLVNGDIVLFHYGKAASHAGFYFDKYIYQSLDNVGVCKINISDKIAKRQMKFAYRILE